MAPRHLRSVLIALTAIALGAIWLPDAALRNTVWIGILVLGLVVTGASLQRRGEHRQQSAATSPETARVYRPSRDDQGRVHVQAWIDLGDRTTEAFQVRHRVDTDRRLCQLLVDLASDKWSAPKRETGRVPLHLILPADALGGLEPDTLRFEGILRGATHCWWDPQWASTLPAGTRLEQRPLDVPALVSQPDDNTPPIYPPAVRDRLVRVVGGPLVTAYTDLEIAIEHAVDRPARRCDLSLTIVHCGQLLRCPFIAVPIDHPIPLEEFGEDDPTSFTYVATETGRTAESIIWDPSWRTDDEMRWHIRSLPSDG